MSTVSNFLIPCVYIQNSFASPESETTVHVRGIIWYLWLCWFHGGFFCSQASLYRPSIFKCLFDNFSLLQCISQLEFGTTVLFVDTFTEFDPVFPNSCLGILLYHNN